jgi:hypothetical protein
MDEWNMGIMGKKLKTLNPLFHHSIIPIFQLFSDSSIPICLLCGLCVLCGDSL